MSSNPTSQKSITELIQAWKQGSSSAGDTLFEIIYPTLRKISGKILAREGRDLTLETSDLLQETFLKLSDQKKSQWSDRNHFFAVSARVVRRIIMDHARRRNRQKRGGGFIRATLDRAAEQGTGYNDDWLALDEALKAFEGVNPTAAKVVELRYFGGLNNEEIAYVMDMGLATVGRHARFAKAWLKNALASLSPGKMKT